MERSASSITNLLDPRTTIVTVFPGLVQPVIFSKQIPNYEFGVRVKTNKKPKQIKLNYNTVTLSSFPEPFKLISSANSADPSMSVVNWSI